MVYRPTARVLTVLELLLSHGRMTGPDLARRLEVNIRTVRDYIAMLVDLGIPVESERGRYGAYRLRPGYKLPPLIFTEDEATALTLSLLLARKHGITRTSPALESLLAKVERVLPTTTRSRVQAIEQTVHFWSSSFEVAPQASVVMALSSAIQSAHCVELRYQSAHSNETTRTFDPYGVVYHEGFWYTIGYCHLRQGQRLFRLDRILQIEVLADTFSPPDNFQALEEVQRALASVPRTWRIEVWLQITLEEVQRQTRLSKAQFIAADNGVIMRGDVADLPWVARFLAGLGVPFIIHHPPELRAAIQHYAHTLANHAEQSATKVFERVDGQDTPISLVARPENNTP
ncbi:YafY family transcriptional regulator [Ktedonosporobacter rubrisoli]|uniref:YafY family transcriptional regulator n=1 Tax=Ktedonosporobacter rubrisoli TaxID=2509675 RepID=A0A4P6JN04_KTERU|nr:YafY family protein [Ktedonosporobacter rubrisoli]QBD76086.1 YafY family transcriptional regulator [Ktedonosporobacter rubrisoli]